jgi:hypothetical protein
MDRKPFSIHFFVLTVLLAIPAAAGTIRELAGRSEAS